MTYPKIFTHRNDHNSKVVIANAEQEAQLPADYLPPVTLGDTGQTMSGADAAAQVMLSPEYDALLADREQLEKDRTAFAEEVNKMQRDMAEQARALEDGRTELQADREKLTEGYKASMAQLETDRSKLETDRQKLAAEIEDWNKTNAENATAKESSASTASTTPAKRTRTAKAD